MGSFGRGDDPGASGIGHVISVGDLDDEDDRDLIPNLMDDAVVANANPDEPISSPTLKCQAPGRPGIVGRRTDRSVQSSPGRARQGGQFFRG